MIFKTFGSRSKVIAPLKIYGAKNISIGNKVIVEYNTWLAAYPHTGEENCSLIIGDGTHIGHFNHIYATGKIHIGKKVLTADKVYISDNLHSYSNIDLPVIDQQIKQLSEITIGDGAWLGENVCVIGASVGKGSVVGANAVVIKNIPDYCVAVGNPAKIIKRYDRTSGEWLRTTPDGGFLKT
ncbi:acyltransferase [Mucilaginibacter sp. BJC16-A38]|uniref:acyltransferase n=1 Tax=Mucilaginibacter phenanthrenivorans TaxID=1234842 RepID=UPI0021578DD8|nr:acyltransferase [Mucilaginibacter phenanthrenivorans]MCR8560150.1 acyltransferase [Mucilaginibacter phenanthrenivorans]